jgi:hypothetical protein
MVKEAKALEYFGPARSLLVHLAPLWKAAADLICRRLCRSLRKQHPNKWENAATALTHPEILRRSTAGEGHPFKTTTGVVFYFDDLDYDGLGESVMDEIKKYLCDRERAGRYFVDGEMYATLCLRLFNVVLASDTL